jgi:hypothetical protein
MPPPLRQAPWNHDSFPPPGDGLAMALASRNLWFPFSEDSDAFNDPYAFNSMGHRDTNVDGTVNRVHDQDIAFRAPPPALHNAYTMPLPVEIPSANSFTTACMGSIPTLPRVYQGNFVALAGCIPAACGAIEHTNTVRSSRSSSKFGCSYSCDRFRRRPTKLTLSTSGALFLSRSLPSHLSPLILEYLHRMRIGPTPNFSKFVQRCRLRLVLTLRSGWHPSTQAIYRKAIPHLRTRDMRNHLPYGDSGNTHDWFLSLQPYPLY